MDEKQRDTLWSLMKSTRVAILTTETDGELRARPMATTQSEFDGTLWFFSRQSAPKVGEVKKDHHVGVTYADTGKQNFVSLSGVATVLRDRATIDAHWSEPLATWFPKGKDDPDIVVLKVEVSSAEYWDAPNQTLVHTIGYVKAKLTGTPPSGGENEKISVS